MALTTKSTSGRVATLIAPADPCTTSIPLTPAVLRCDRRISASTSVASEITLGFQRRACSNAAPTLCPAARETTSKRPEYDSTTLRVLRPIEPVEPRMAMRVMSGTVTPDFEQQDLAGGSPGLTHSDQSTYSVLVFRECSFRVRRSRHPPLCSDSNPCQ